MSHYTNAANARQHKRELQQKEEFISKLQVQNRRIIKQNKKLYEQLKDAKCAIKILEKGNDNLTHENARLTNVIHDHDFGDAKELKAKLDDLLRVNSEMHESIMRKDATIGQLRHSALSKSTHITQLQEGIESVQWHKDAWKRVLHQLSYVLTTPEMMEVEAVYNGSASEKKTVDDVTQKDYVPSPKPAALHVRVSKVEESLTGLGFVVGTNAGVQLKHYQEFTASIKSLESVSKDLLSRLNKLTAKVDDLRPGGH